MPAVAAATAAGAANFRQVRKSAIEAFERAFVEQTLREHRGNVTRSAKAVGKDRRAFGRLVKKYSIQRESA